MSAIMKFPTKAWFAITNFPTMASRNYPPDWVIVATTTTSSRCVVTMSTIHQRLDAHPARACDGDWRLSAQQQQ